MHRRLPSLNALRAFEAAARHVSFSRAADELFVTHAAVSRHIRDLEAWLDVSLFKRTGRGVIVTEAGEAYARRLTRAFDDMADATRHVLDSAEAPHLNISAEPAFAALWLVPRLVKFAELYPDVELSVDPADELVNFRSESTDLAIRYGDGKWPDTDATLLVRSDVFAVCSPDYQKQKGIETPEDLSKAVLLHEATKAWWSDWLSEANLTELKTTRGPLFQGHLAIEAASAGQGVALADVVTASEGLFEGWLVSPFDITVQDGAYYVVSPSGRKETAHVQAFREWLIKEMADTEARVKALTPS